MPTTPTRITTDTARRTADFMAPVAPQGPAFDADRKTSAGIADTLMLPFDLATPKKAATNSVPPASNPCWLITNH